MFSDGKGGEAVLNVERYQSELRKEKIVHRCVGIKGV
jgi:hypothetical protein